MKKFIIFVCKDSTEIFLSKLRSSCSNYNLPSFFTDSYCALAESELEYNTEHVSTAVYVRVPIVQIEYHLYLYCLICLG